MSDIFEAGMVAADQTLQCIQQGGYNEHCQKLAAFLQASARYVTEKKSQATNIIDRGSTTTNNKTYGLDAPRLAEFYTHVEQARRSGATYHFLERQGSPEDLYSGIMLDFDIALKARPVAAVSTVGCGRASIKVPKVLDDRAYRNLTSLIAKVLVDNIVVESPDMAFHVFYIVRPEAPELPSGQFKYGFHVLIPGVHTTRGFKKYFIEKLRQSPRLHKILADVGAVGTPGSAQSAGALAVGGPLTACLDHNSASVPVHLLGSCKKGGLLYHIGAAYIVEANMADIKDGTGLACSPLPESSLAASNLCYEMSLWARPPFELLAQQAVTLGAPPPAPLLAPRKYTFPDDIRSQVETMSERLFGGLLSVGEFEATNGQVVALCMEDPDASYLNQMLSLLDDTYPDDYAKWRNVIMALSNASRECRNTPDAYYPLACLFSQRSPEKWRAGGRAALDLLWSDVATTNPKGKDPVWKPLTKRSIIHWARLCSPEKCRELSNNNYRTTLSTFVYGHGGDLRHAMVAEVLYQILSARFVTDAADEITNKPFYTWYEFVTSGQPMKPGEVWKWRREANPDAIHKFISNDLCAIAREISEDVNKQKKDADTPEKTKYYTNIGKKLAGSIARLFDNNFKNQVIDQARYLFRKRGFNASLDKEPSVIGVGNGILRISGPGRPESQLISCFHEWPVLRYTAVEYRPFDETNSWTVILLDAIKKIIPETDMRVWFMMFLSTGLYHGLKDPTMLLMDGSGGNAKTWLARMAAKSLGEYASKLHISLLVSDREDASKPNSAFMRMKDRGFVYYEESNKKEVLNSSRLKETVNPGEVTASEKNKAQEVFDITATSLSLSNFGFIIDTKDDGTWRRLGRYRAKAKFCPKPDPNNPYEHLEDSRFIDSYVNDPDCLSAFLSIMVHFWDRLQREYDGKIRTIHCPTLERETEEYRNTQDVLNRFIIERVVITPAAKCDEDGFPPDTPITEPYTLSGIATKFCAWYTQNIDASNRRYVATEVIGDLENSTLSRFMTTTTNGMRVLIGCRCLSDADAANGLLRPGEEHMGTRAKKVTKTGTTDASVIPPPGHTPIYQQVDGKRVHQKEPVKWWDWSMEIAKPKKKRAPGGGPACPASAAELRASLADDLQMSDRRTRRAVEAARNTKEELDSEESQDALLDLILEGELAAADLFS
jgi:phage/plasmid-associated DNA primase